MTIFVEKKSIREILSNMEEGSEGFKQLNELVAEDKTTHPVTLFYKLGIENIERRFHDYATGLEAILYDEKYPEEVSPKLNEMTNKIISSAARKVLAILKGEEPIDPLPECYALCEECQSRTDGSPSPVQDYLDGVWKEQ